MEVLQRRVDEIRRLGQDPTLSQNEREALLDELILIGRRMTGLPAAQPRPPEDVQAVLDMTWVPISTGELI